MEYLRLLVFVSLYNARARIYPIFLPLFESGPIIASVTLNLDQTQVNVMDVSGLRTLTGEPF